MNEDFEKLLEESFEDPKIMEALKEKQMASAEKRKSAGELVKDYPMPQREIDLHGHTSTEAMLELDHFIKLATQHRVRTVRVITGKGLHSKHMHSVLPEKTEQKLSQLRRDKRVLAFRKEKTGGSYLVYLIS